MAEAREASSVVTSNNAAEFYAERLGLSESVEPTEAEDVKESSEPEQKLEQTSTEMFSEARENPSW